MPSSSSRPSILFSRRPIQMRLAVHDGPAGLERGTTGRFDLKEIQRRAFERGQELEREKSSRALAAVIATIRSEAAARDAAFAADRRSVEEFAARLALAVAEKLTFAVIDAEEHDVAAMVQVLLGELGPAAGGDGLELRLNPKDHALVLEAAAEGAMSLDGISASADPAVKPGGAVIEGREVEYWSDLNDRIERVRSRLLEETRHV